LELVESCKPPVAPRLGVSSALVFVAISKQWHNYF
jgi:hypothetical protein